MTDAERLQKEKLQKLFQAALHDVNSEKVTLARAYPKSTLDTLAAHAAAVPASVAPVQPEREVMVAARVVTPVPLAADMVQPMENAGLDTAAAEELRILLDEQNLRIKRKRLRETVGALVVFLALSGGGFGWFVQSPNRVQAVREALREVRSVGDIAGMVGKYKNALDKVGTHSHNLDEATVSMGGSADQTGMKDVNMDAEMKEMMGEQGDKTDSVRNRVLKEKFGNVKAGAAAEPAQLTTAAEVDPSLSLSH